jgi:hypothetical protein
MIIRKENKMIKGEKDSALIESIYENLLGSNIFLDYYQNLEHSKVIDFVIYSKLIKHFTTEQDYPFVIFSEDDQYFSVSNDSKFDSNKSGLYEKIDVEKLEKLEKNENFSRLVSTFSVSNQLDVVPYKDSLMAFQLLSIYLEKDISDYEVLELVKIIKDIYGGD